jgi:hypothetical protein
MRLWGVFCSNSEPKFCEIAGQEAHMCNYKTHRECNLLWSKHNFNKLIPDQINFFFNFLNFYSFFNPRNNIQESICLNFAVGEQFV